MCKAIVIIDFNNCFRGSIMNITQEQYKNLFTNVIEEILQKNGNNISEILVRLYGGWYQNHNLTNVASDVQTKVQQIDLFPIIKDKKKYDGCIEVVSTQYGLSEVWYNTLQEKAGIPRLRIDEEHQDIGCEQRKEICPVHILQKFLQKKATICRNPGCKTEHSKVFYRREQKMIDTMMTCDIITYSAEEDVAALYIVSDDIDLFPGIAISKFKNNSIDMNLFVRTTQTKLTYQQILSTYNINIKSLEL